MKIALVGPTPPPHGGIAVHMEALAGALRAAGNEVELLDPARSGSPVSFALALGSLTARGFQLHVHTNGHNAKSWALAAAAGLARTPWQANVITLHSGLLPGYLEGMPERRRLARLALAPYGKIIAVSRSVAEAVAGLGIEGSRIVELPAFIPAAVRPGELPEAARLAREQHDVLLSAALAPSPIYGARVLWPAVDQLRRSRPNLGVAVFGPGTEQLGAELAAAGLEKSVVALGELSHAEALAVMAVSDAFIRPTLADGDAISVREALALGIPTVASDVAQRPQGTRTFRTGDPFALAEVIAAALDGEPPRADLTDALPALMEMYRDMSNRAPRLRVQWPAARRRQLGFAPGF